MLRINHVMPVLCLVLAPACGGPDSSVEDRGQGLFAYAYQGELVAGTPVKRDLKNGDFAHTFKWNATAGETVTFVLEWHEPESLGLGAELWVKDGLRLLGQASSADLPRAHLSVTFPRTGTFTVYAGHHDFGWFGVFPYEIGANVNACVIVYATSAEFAGWQGYAATQYWTVTEAAWSWVPPWPEDAAIQSREVLMGRCDSIFDATCDESDPEVCGSDPVFGPGIFENECAVRNYTHSQASMPYDYWWISGWANASFCSE